MYLRPISIDMYGHISTLICAIRLPLQIGSLFAHANYLGAKLDHKNSQLCLAILIATTINTFCYGGNKYSNSFGMSIN